jgi:hypothetical protein
MLTLIILSVGVLLSCMLPQRSTEGRLQPKGRKKSQKAHGTKVNPCGETAGRIFLLRSTYSEYFVLIPKTYENTKFSENYFCCNLSCYKFSQFSAFRSFSESRRFFFCIPKEYERTKFSENYFCCNLSCYKFSQFSAFRAFSESRRFLLLYPERIRKNEIIRKLFFFAIFGFSGIFGIQNLTGTYHMRLELRIRTGSM